MAVKYKADEIIKFEARVNNFKNIVNDKFE